MLRETIKGTHGKQSNNKSKITPINTESPTEAVSSESVMLRSPERGS